MKYMLWYQTEKIAGAIMGKARSEGWQFLTDFDTLDDLQKFVDTYEKEGKQQVADFPYSPHFKYHWKVIKGVEIFRQETTSYVEEVVLKKVTEVKPFIEKP